MELQHSHYSNFDDNGQLDDLHVKEYCKSQDCYRRRLRMKHFESADCDVKTLNLCCETECMYNLCK